MPALVVAVSAAFAAAAPAVVENDAPVHLGVIADVSDEPDRAFGAYGDLVARLRERLAPAGVGVGDLVIARDLDDLSQRIVRGQVDLVVDTVYPTLLLQERSRMLEPALVVVRRGQREYRTVFFTRRDAPIRRLADLRGRTLVLQVLRSTSAFAMPRAELARAGIALVAADDPRAGRDNVRYVLAMAEINEAIWVLQGRGDAGAFNDGNWAALPEKVRSQLRVFHESPPIVRALCSFRTGVPAVTRKHLADALLALHTYEAGRAALERAVGVTRFERLTPADRRSLRAWAPILRPGRPR